MVFSPIYVQSLITMKHHKRMRIVLPVIPHSQHSCSTLLCVILGFPFRYRKAQLTRTQSNIKSRRNNVAAKKAYKHKEMYFPNPIHEISRVRRTKAQQEEQADLILSEMLPAIKESLKADDEDAQRKLQW